MANKKLVKVSLQLPDKSRKYFYGKTKKEAEQKREEAKRKLLMGYDVGNSTTFGELAELWLEEYKAQRKLHVRTKESTEDIVKRYILPELGNRRVKDIKPANIDRMLLNISHLSKSTQEKVLTYTNKIFNKAVENDIIPRSPAFNKKATADKPEKVRPLTDAQCEALLKATKGTRVYPFIVTCLFSGLRKGEAAGLMWKDLDFENRMISVERSIVWPKSNRQGEINTMMKSDAAHRKIPMAPEIYQVLKPLKSGSKSLYVFPCKSGSFMTAESIRSMWSFVTNRTVGGPSTGYHLKPTLDFHVTPHVLRHTCCTRWIASGMQPKEAQYLMGHSSPDITMAIYAEYMAEQELPKTAEKINSDSLRLALG